MVSEILVVDDDDIMLDLLEMFLGEHGYNLTRATDGAQAINALAGKNFDLVITDLEMGQISGFDVIQRAKEQCRKTIIIMITSCHGVEHEIKALRLGADFFLFKPFSMSALLRCIQVQEIRTDFYSSVQMLHRERRFGRESG